MNHLPMQKQCFGLLGLFLSFGLACNLFAFTTSGKTFRTDGSQADVNAAIAKASAGDTIEIPAGSFTWGTGGEAVRVNKAVVVQGTGRDRTTIYIANSAPCWNSGTIEITAGATVRNFATVQPNGRPTTVFSAGGANGCAFPTSSTPAPPIADTSCMPDPMVSSTVATLWAVAAAMN